MPTTTKISKRQTELLQRICLKRYTVRLHHYMGWFNPNEYVTVEEERSPTDEQRAYTDRTFRPSTVEALRSKGLVRYVKSSQGVSIILPTRAGLDLFTSPHMQAKR